MFGFNGHGLNPGRHQIWKDQDLSLKGTDNMCSDHCGNKLLYTNYQNSYIIQQFYVVVPNLDRGAPVTSTHWMGLKTTKTLKLPPTDVSHSV